MNMHHHKIEMSLISHAHWGPSQYKERISGYADFHYKDKAIVRPSYLYNWNSYTGKTTSLYRDEPLVSRGWCSIS